MWTKKILVGLPLCLIAVMLQSVLWVPTQKRQGESNPKRLEEYYEGTIGDAAILNPILNADSASADVCDKVFDSLLQYNENLEFEGRLATAWDIFEEAYLWIDSQQKFPDGKIIAAQAMKERILAAARQAPKDSPLVSIKEIKILPPSEENRSLPFEPEFLQDNLVGIKVRLPERLQITLSRVEQDLFVALEKVYGHDYLRHIHADRFITLPPAAKKETQKKIIDMLADILAPGEHNPVIRFQLRDNVYFHDGAPFTAADVLFTYQAIMDPKNLSPRTSDYEPIKEVLALNSHEIKVIYKRLYSPAIGTWSMGILPKHLLDEAGLKKEASALGKDPGKFTMRDSQFNRRPIGAGPFKLTEWEPDQYIHLTRNDAYWEGAPQYREYYYRIIPEVKMQEMELYAGTLDGYRPEPVQIERLKDRPEYQYFSGLSFSYSYIGYNMRRKLFQDARVRCALGMAIDVDSLIKYIHYGHAERITGPFLKQTPYYDQSLAPLPYDPQGALKLLEEAGWVKNAQGKLVNRETNEPFQFTLLTNNGNDIRKGILTVAQQAWAKLGIQVETQLVEWSVFIQKNVDTADFDAVVLGWQMGIEPDLYQIWHSSQTHPNQLNFVGYENPKADELIVRIRREYDKDKLEHDCHALHRIIYADQPYTFLSVGRWTALLDRRIVRRVKDANAFEYQIITPTKSGKFDYHFNQWIKLKQNEALPAANPQMSL